jgi:hypothetical protein
MAMMRVTGILSKLVALALVWFAAVAVVHYGLIGTTYPRGLSPGNIPASGTNSIFFFIAAFALISGLVLTERILGLRVRLGHWGEAHEQRKTAAIEPETLRLRDMIALLDEDDLDDLRAEVREGLRDRIRNLTTDENESFEELLSDSKRKRR